MAIRKRSASSPKEKYLRYVKNSWQTDDIITADKLNNIEAGIETNQAQIDEILRQLAGMGVVVSTERSERFFKEEQDDGINFDLTTLVDSGVDISTAKVYSMGTLQFKDKDYTIGGNTLTFLVEAIQTGQYIDIVWIEKN